MTWPRRRAIPRARREARRREMDADVRPSIAVEISDTQGHLRVDRAALAGLARGVLEGEGIARAELSIALVDDPTIRALNRRHLDHDWPTDVIAFRLSAPGAPVLAAELVLSAEMAAATARASGADPRAELALYLVHGLLHLCGYDDRAEEDARAMRRREAEALARAGLPDTFARVGPGSSGAPAGRAGREESP